MLAPFPVGLVGTGSTRPLKARRLSIGCVEPRANRADCSGVDDGGNVDDQSPQSEGIRHAHRTMKRMRRRARTVWVVVGLLAAGHAVPLGADGPRPSDEPPTRHERFLDACSPCVREAHSVATIRVSPPALAALPRAAAAQMARQGEIGVDVLRAYPLGRPTRRSAAIRLTLSVVTGPPSEMYPLGAGLLDEEEVADLGAAVAEMARTLKASPQPGGEALDVDFRGGSVRVGVMRLGGEAIAYVQTGDTATLALRPVWQAPTTLYLTVADLTSLANAIRQSSAKIQTLGAR
jgi:hypothetical protein